jgi:hypothetical protein
MNDAQVLAEWFRRQGRRVLRTASTDWVELGPRVYQAIPFHGLILPHPLELDGLLKDQRALALRYSTHPEAGWGMPSYHVVCDASEYGLEQLGKKARHDVRRGLRAARVGPLGLVELAELGWELRQDTLARQGRRAAESQASWQALCSSAAGLPGFEAWGAWIDNVLAAALLAFSSNGCTSILYQQSRTACLPSGVNHALAFSFTCEVLQRAEGQWLFYGLHSLDAPASVDEFKFRLGYRRRPVRQRVVFHPWLSPLVRPAAGSLLAWARRRMPLNPSLAKAEGLVRFYLRGQAES